MRLLSSVTAPSIPSRGLARYAARARDFGWRGALTRTLVSPWLIGSLLAVGVVARLVRYLADRALWLDESYVALNLMNRSYAQLLGTLDFGQGAPPGFLLAAKLAVNVLGDGEQALRLVPLVAGIAALFLFYLVARELLMPAAVPLALLLFALGEPFVAYSVQVKQYGLDIAVALALVYVFLRLARRADFALRHAIVLTAAGAVAVWLSHTAAFVLAGIGAGMAFLLLQRGDRRGVVRLAIPATAWLVSFGAMYALTLPEISHVEAATGQAAGDAGSPVRNVFMIFYELGLTHWSGQGIAPILGVFGAVSLWAYRRHQPVVVAGAAMLACTVVAGHIGKYPVAHRFILFLLPFGLLCLAEGTARLLRVLPRELAAAFAVVLALTIVVGGVEMSARGIVSPPEREEIKPALAYLGERWREGDTLYVMGSSQYAFRYYLECSDCGDAIPAPVRAAVHARPQSGPIQTTPALVSETPDLVVGAQKRLAYAREVEELRGRERVWVLLSNRFRARSTVMEPFMRLGFERECSPEYGGAFVCLYNLGAYDRPR